MSERNEDNHSAETPKRPRRNQPRHPVAKESTTAADVTTSAEDLLKEACEPLTEGEIQQWPGWIELESEPVRTSLCLSKLGRGTAAAAAAATCSKAFFEIGATADTATSIFNFFGLDRPFSTQSCKDGV